MPTLNERRRVQIEYAEADERFWSGFQAVQEEFSAGHKAVAALCERKADEAKDEADKAAARAASLRDRLSRSKRGEDIAAGAGKQISMKEATEIMGGKAAVRRAIRVTEIFKAGNEEELIEEMVKRDRRSDIAAINSLYRRCVLKKSP
jgi:hypothetical protein